MTHSKDDTSTEHLSTLPSPSGLAPPTPAHGVSAAGSVRAPATAFVHSHSAAPSFRPACSALPVACLRLAAYHRSVMILGFGLGSACMSDRALSRAGPFLLSAACARVWACAAFVACPRRPRISALSWACDSDSFRRAGFLPLRFFWGSPVVDHFGSLARPHIQPALRPAGLGLTDQLPAPLRAIARFAEEHTAPRGRDFASLLFGLRHGSRSPRFAAGTIA